ncbi:MAG: FkbM family methyltransferase [Cyanobacteria bacterium J06621_15]
MKIFLDVGAHIGQTIDAVVAPKYEFDKIFCFEPCEESILQLKQKQILDSRIEIQQFGLYKENVKTTIFGKGDIGASIFKDHSSLENSSVPCETIQLIKVSDWFRDNLSEDDEVYMKLNCEGCECDIINDLLDTGEYSKLTSVMIDFDVRKIPSKSKQEKFTRQRLADEGYKNYCYCEDVMVGGSHISRVRNWLDIVCADRCSHYTKIMHYLYVFVEIFKGQRSGLYFDLTIHLKRNSPQAMYGFIRYFYKLIK